MIRTRTMHAFRLAPFAAAGVLGGLLAALLAGCAPTVPYQPSWSKDVKPILLANCARCHSHPAIGGAPNYFRLDVYQNTTDASGMPVMGAGASAMFISNDITKNTMPPRFKLSDRQKRIIANWIAAGAPGPGSTARAAVSGPDAGAEVLR